MSDITINAASYVSANTQTDSEQFTKLSTAGQSATTTAGPEADAVRLSINAQARLMLQQGMNVAQIAVNLGISVQAASTALELAANSIAVPVALPHADSTNQ